MLRLANKVAIVTGAAQGLGRAFCLKLAAEGARVVAADINLDGATSTAQAIQSKGAAAIALQVDVSSEADTRQMAAATLAHWGRIDILVNNAAVYQGLARKSFEDIHPDEWDRVMAVNLKGPWLCARAVVPAMKQQCSGKIINVASATFFSGSPLWAHYLASKGGVIGLTRVLAKELGAFGICINAIAPGFTMTEASRELIPDAERYGVERGAIKRAEQPKTWSDWRLSWRQRKAISLRDRRSWLTGDGNCIDNVGQIGNLSYDSQNLACAHIDTSACPNVQMDVSSCWIHHKVSATDYVPKQRDW